MIIDAIVLAGGRSSRLGGVPKSALLHHGHSLLETAVDATSTVRHRVVVGVVPQGVALPQPVYVVREDPPFGGPASAIAAGMRQLSRLDGALSDVTLVLACDMPNVRGAVAVLLAAVAGGAVSLTGVHELKDVDGLVARDDSGHQQPLVAAYRTSSLTAAIEAQSATNGVDGLAVHALTRDLSLLPIAVPLGSTDDVDTWADVARFGISPLDISEMSRGGEGGSG